MTQADKVLSKERIETILRQNRTDSPKELTIAMRMLECLKDGKKRYTDLFNNEQKFRRSLPMTKTPLNMNDWYDYEFTLTPTQSFKIISGPDIERMNFALEPNFSLEIANLFAKDFIQQDRQRQPYYLVQKGISHLKDYGLYF